MKRRILIALLSLGVVGGYGSSLAHALHHHHAACSGWHHGPPGEAPTPER